MAKVKSSELAADANFKNVMKMVMPFIKFKMDEANLAGASALNTKLMFDEQAVLTENIDFIKRAVGVSEIKICFTTDEAAGSKADEATPGAPACAYVVVEDIAAGVDAVKL